MNIFVVFPNFISENSTTMLDDVRSVNEINLNPSHGKSRLLVGDKHQNNSDEL